MPQAGPLCSRHATGDLTALLCGTGAQQRLGAGLILGFFHLRPSGDSPPPKSQGGLLFSGHLLATRAAEDFGMEIAEQEAEEAGAGTQLTRRHRGCGVEWSILPSVSSCQGQPVAPVCASSAAAAGGPKGSLTPSERGRPHPFPEGSLLGSQPGWRGRAAGTPHSFGALNDLGGWWG